MDEAGVAVRSLAAGDLDWVVELAARRRAALEVFAPRFWRRAPDARRVHALHLKSLIEDPAVPAMRTDHAFAFGVPQPGFVLIDDAAAERAEQWSTEGAALVRGLAGESRVRLVCPVPEPERSALAVGLGLRCVEAWWHRDLTEQNNESGYEEPMRGRLVPAPPVYAPGGPVLLVTAFDDARDLAGMEREATSRGAVVSVVSLAAGDVDREDLLLAAGYRRTCDFHEGTALRQ